MGYPGRQPIVERTKYQVASGAPSNPLEGDVYLNDGSGSVEYGLYAYNGIAWQKVNYGKENWLMNGWFGISTRGTTFNVSAVRRYLDRWISDSVFGGTGVVSQLAFSPGASNDRFLMRFTQGTVSINLFQQLEKVATTVNKTFTVSFETVSDGATVAQTFLAEQFFGTGGSPSAPVTVLSQGYNITSVRTKHTFTFTTPSISGKTLGNNNDDGLRIYLTTSSGTGSAALNWIKVMMNEGFEPSVFIPFGGSEQADRIACLRYVRKSYSENVTPGTATTAGMQEWECNGFTNGSYTIRRNVHWGEHMRATPTVTLWDSAGTINQVNVASGAVAGTVDLVSTTGFRANGADGVSGTTRRLAHHYLAEAEY